MRRARGAGVLVGRGWRGRAWPGLGSTRWARARVQLLPGLASGQRIPGSFDLSACLWTRRLSSVPDFLAAGPGQGCSVRAGCKVKPGEPQMPSVLMEL